MPKGIGVFSVKRIAEPEALLAQGLQELKLESALEAPLLAYLAELVKWNAAYNLTAVRDPAEMVTRHLLDSLAMLPHLDAIRTGLMLDVGSGAGLPGLVLAMARPDWRIDVLDSNGKKARFLRHVQRSLHLDNVQVFETRAEALRVDAPYAAITSRAFAALGDFVAATEHLLADQGHWLAMKGRLDDNELAALSPAVYSLRAARLAVPGLREERHLVIATRQPSSP